MQQHTYAIPVNSYSRSMHVEVKSRFPGELREIVAPIGASSKRECHYLQTYLRSATRGNFGERSTEGKSHLHH